MQTDTIEYFSRDDCPGTFFRCDKMRATLTVFRCSAMWKEANASTRKPDPCDRLHHCKRCEVGAEHAGEKLIACSSLFGARICSRCHRPSARLIHGEHCPSCYNREREVLIGRNGKGTKPVKHAALEPRRLVVACDGRVTEKLFQHTVDAAETIVSVLRHVQGVVLFGFRGRIVASRPRPTQMELPL
jgi:hypothetical protein